jgi:hypothetical protein
MKNYQSNFMKLIPAWCMALVFFSFSCQELNTDAPIELSDEFNSYEGNDLVPGMYIVTLNETWDELSGITFRKSGKYEDVQFGMRKIASDVVGKYNVSSQNVKTVFGSALTGFTVFLSESELKALKKDPSVKSIVQDRYMIDSHSMRKTGPGKPGDGPEPDPQPDPEPEIKAFWNQDRIDQRNLPLDGIYSPPNAARNVTAYIIGRGINLNHVEFEGRASNVNLTNGEITSNIGATEIAGVIGGKTVGVAKGVNLVGVVSMAQSYGSDQATMLSDFLLGLDWVHANANSPSVVYIPPSGPIEGLSGELMDLINTTIDALNQKGISLFAASGAWNVDACTWVFLNHPNVFTTGMSDKFDYRRENSNFGSCIDLFAPGTDILTADGSNNTGYRIGNEIVVTAAQTMGVAAMYLQTNPSASPQQVYDFLKTTSTKNVVRLAKSVNNHLLFSGLNDIGAGVIDPSLNFDFELDAAANKVNGTTWRVNLSWTPIEGDRLNLYVDGVGFANVINSGFLSLEVKGKSIAPKTYRLCVPGTTQCSNTVNVNF